MSVEYDFDGTSGSFRVTNPEKRLADLLRVEQAKLNRLVISGASDTQIDELQRSIKNLMIKAQEMEKTLSARNEKIMELQRTNQQQQAINHERLESLTNKAQQEFEVLMQNAETMQQRIEELEQSFANQQSACKEKLQNQNEKHQTELVKAKQVYEYLMQTAEELQGDIRKLQQEKSSIEQDMLKVSQNKVLAEIKIETLKTKLKNQKAEHEQERVELLQYYRDAPEELQDPNKDELGDALSEAEKALERVKARDRPAVKTGRRGRPQTGSDSGSESKTQTRNELKYQSMSPLDVLDKYKAVPTLFNRPLRSPRTNPDLV
ncbi:MAG: hypothetical protein CMI29_05515 [Opitutae bacterium]|nr:hypothetical protein [Opitutae bacterium]